MSTSSKGKRLKKELGLLNVYAIATGTTLSAGFFLLPGLAVQHAGPAVILAYLIAAIPLIPAMFSIVELGTAMPRAGGAYYFLDRSMGPLVGTIGGIGTWIALVFKTTFALIGMGAYVQLIFPNLPVLPLALAFALLFGAINMVGAKSAGLFQVLLVGGLLSILVWFMGGGMPHVNLAHFSGFFDKGWDAIFSTAGLVYISYVGVTKVASVSEEIKDPEKSLPRGVFLSLGTAILIYAVGLYVMTGVAGASGLEGDYTPVATTAKLIFGEWGVKLITIAALCAFASVTNAGILSASRYPLAMSRDHLLPSFFCKLSRRDIPISGVLVTVGSIVVILLLLNATKIAKLASAFQLLMFALLCLAVIVMRESKIPSYDPGYRSPCYPWIQILGIVFPALLIASMGWLPVLFTTGLLAVSVGWYFRYAHKYVRREGAIYHIFERLGRRRYEELDTELRGILKEKGLRAEDPFDDIVTRAHVIDLEPGKNFEAAARKASHLLAQRVNSSADHLLDGFMKGTRIGATPVSHSAALPHLRLPAVADPQMVLVRVKEGLYIDMADAFEGQEDQSSEPVYAIMFLISSKDDPGQHLRILSQIASRVDDSGFMGEWLQSADDQAMKESLLRNDRYLSLYLQEGFKTSPLIKKTVHALSFPPGCLIAIIRRGDSTFVPQGNTTLREGDRLTIIGDEEGIRDLQAKYR
ncbi:MAG: amino acid permease [Kiritimatiellae bacterium]|nr:amino acid permease [Kiritimatiellia bacterium]